MPHAWLKLGIVARIPTPSAARYQPFPLSLPLLTLQSILGEREHELGFPLGFTSLLTQTLSARPSFPSLLV